MSDRLGAAPILVGTRGSALALAQTERVIRRLSAVHPTVAFVPKVIATEGDVDKTSPLTLIGGRGVFTAGVQAALADRRVDVAVHSAKDLPPREPPGLVLAAFPEREDPRDVLVSRHGVGLADLPPRPRIGTSSQRRAMQVRLVRPDAEIVELRGNVDTRLRKALAGDLDAIVLAAAGVVRLGRSDRVTEWLPLDRFIPAPGQGALAVEARDGDQPTRDLLGAIDDPRVSPALRAERAFLDALGAGCTTPLGAFAAEDGGRWILRAMLGDKLGERIEWIESAIDPAAPEAGAAAAATELLRRFGRLGFSAGTPASGADRVVDGGELGDHAASKPMNGRAGVAAAGDGDSLAGLRIVVTRPREQAAPLVAALRQRGADPIELPTIRIEPARDTEALTRSLLAAADGGYDWVVFTSVNAVRSAAETLRRTGRDGFKAGSPRVAVVGRRTAAALTEHGMPVDMVAEPSTTEGVVASLIEAGIAGKRVLYPHGDLARDAIPRGLVGAGAVVDAVEAYRTESEADVRGDALAAVAAGHVDVVTFASPSSVRALLAALDGNADALDAVRVVCIGPVTADAARACGLRVDAVADDASVDGIIAAVAAQSRTIGNRRQRSAAR